MLLDTQPHKVPPVTEPIEPWRQLLLDAADLIERQGWWNGKPGKSLSVHCIQTAISATALRGALGCEAAVNFLNYIGGHGIVSWNDAPGRTKEEVLAAMRGAARS